MRCLTGVLSLLVLMVGCDAGEEVAREESKPDFQNVSDPRPFLLQLQAEGVIPEADVNRDGFVDIHDLVLVAKAFGERIEPPALPPGLPAFLAGYDRWTRLNRDPIPPRAGDPHNGFKDVYVNRTVPELAPQGRQQFPYPDGAVVVKQAIRAGEDFVWLVAVMVKIRGGDPAHGDWKFVEYTRRGRDHAFDAAARDAVCWGCHAGALATDYVFTTLE
jgi:hypothetical protein